MAVPHTLLKYYRVCQPKLSFAHKRFINSNIKERGSAENHAVLLEREPWQGLNENQDSTLCSVPIELSFFYC